jgi:hypothetical protein
MYGESPCGFVLRVSDLNGYTTPRNVFQMADCARNEMFSIRMDMCKIARVLGRAPEELTGYQDPKEVDYFRLKIHGHHLTAKDLSISTPKVCPECVLDHGHIPVWTDFSIVDACPWHGRLLLTHCSDCKQKLSWLRPGLLVCRCNADISRMRGSPVTKVHCEFLRQLVAKILGRESANKLAMPVDKFNAMTLSSVLGFSTAMARIDSAANKVPRSIAEGAARMLLDWPNSLYLSIKKLIPPDAVRNGYVDLSKHMEGVYQSILRDIVDASDIAFLRSVINQFTQSLIDQKPFAVALSDEEIEALEPVNDADSLSMRLSEGFEVAPRMWKKRKSNTLGPREPWLPFESGTRNFGQRQAARYIGLPVSVLKTLRQAGEFEVRHRTVSVVRFHERDLDAFTQKMMALAQFAPPSSNETELVSLGSLMKLKFKFVKGKADLVAAMLDGRISVLGCSGQGVQDLLVSRSQIEEFVESSRERSFGGAWTEHKVSKVLHCDFSVVEALMRDGYLTGTKYVGGLRIDVESVKAFQSRYRSLASLAKEHQTTAATLVRWLKEGPFELLSLQRASTDFLQTFILVADIPRFVETVLPGLIDKRRKPFTCVTALDRLEAYLSNLRATGEKLPRLGLKPHHIKIADSCGFERSMFYKDDGVKKAIKVFDAEDRRRNMVISPKDALEKYLAHLSKVGGSPPYCGSKPNLRSIANSCGFSRDVFYYCPDLKIMVQEHSLSGR